MKKARIVLTALTVLAVVGGALAFKAQKAFGGNLRCTDIPNVPCLEKSYVTSGSGIEKFCTYTSITTETEPCFLTTVVEQP